MDSIIRDQVAVPTVSDADDLIAILSQPIQGAPPGRIDADGPGGKSRPPDRNLAMFGWLRLADQIFV